MDKALFFVFFAPVRGYLSATTWRALRHCRENLSRFASRSVCGHEHNLDLDGAAQSHFPDAMAGQRGFRLLRFCS